MSWGNAATAAGRDLHISLVGISCQYCGALWALRLLLLEVVLMQQSRLGLTRPLPCHPCTPCHPGTRPCRLEVSAADPAARAAALAAAKAGAAAAHAQRMEQQERSIQQFRAVEQRLMA
jgi:hypothetical protein